MTFAIGRLGWSGFAGLSVSGGAQLGWVDAEARRQTRLGTIDQTVNGAIEGDYVQLFGEFAYRLPVSSFVAEPFVGVSHVSLHLDRVIETEAPTALVIAAIDRKVTFADIGLRVSGDAGSSVRPFASAAYRHAWGDRASVASFGFAGFAGTGLVAAVPIARSAAELSGGLVVTRGMIDFEVGYDATISKAFDSHGVSAGLKVRF